MNNFGLVLDYKNKELNSIKEKKKEFTNLKDVYVNLKEKLDTLPNELEYDCFVPIASGISDNFENTTAGMVNKSKKRPPLAFMPGKLIHTNEILVHLGDNWFVEKSAKQSQEILERRIMKCDNLLEKLELNEKQLNEWIGKIDDFKKENEELVEIYEDFNEEEEKKWKEKHKENVRKQKEKERLEREKLAKNNLEKKFDLEKNFALLSTVVEKAPIENKTKEMSENKPMSKFKKERQEKKL